MHLRFDIAVFSFPEAIRMRLHQPNDHRIRKDSIVVIKAQKFRSLEKRRANELRRQEDLISPVA